MVTTRTGREDRERDARFSRFFETHRERIHRTLWRLCGNADIADDLTQEVALAALSAQATFRHESAPFTFLYRIAVRVAHRHRERARPPCDDESTLDGVVAAHGSPDDAALASSLNNAIDALPEHLRVALILKVRDGLTCREIAQILEIPLGTVLSRLHDARAKLRPLLETEKNP